MDDQTRVWLIPRELKRRHGPKCKAGCTCKAGKCDCGCKCPRRFAYDLRWIDPSGAGWKHKAAGRDRKAAERLAATLEVKLAAGTYKELRKISWRDFSRDHVSKIEGRANAVEAEQVLREFGNLMQPPGVKAVTFSMIEAYIVKLRAKGLKPATINKKITYLKAAINKAIRRGYYAAENPIARELFQAVENKPPREVTPTEEAALLNAAEDLYGFRWRAFVYVALNIGARRGELLSLPWERIDLKGAEVHISKTKSHNDRRVPINPDVVSILRRLKVQTQIQGGPFAGMGSNIGRAWGRIVARAAVSHVTIHDLRRTYITRLVRLGSAMAHVQRLAGHKRPETTLRYYTWVSSDDLRQTVAKLNKAAG